MTQARILRRVPQAQERIRLGASQPPPPHPIVPGGDFANQREVAAPSEAQQALERSLQEAAGLRGQLDQAARERRQLQVVVDDLRSEVAAAKDEARRQGHAEGLRQAQAEAQRELAERAAQWQRTLEEASRQFEAQSRTLRSELAEVVMAAVTKLLGEHLLNPQSIRAVIEHTLREAGSGGPAKVLIAPPQYETLVRYGPAHLAALRERRIEVAPDTRVSCGGCLVELVHGLADGRFEVQLARLREVLANHDAAGSVPK